MSFRTGVSRKYFRKEWQPVLDVIHRYVTCEGHLSFAYVYHLRLMVVFLSFPVNLPYYLFQSMTKMSSAIKKGPKNIRRSLFHHGLVRILVERELSKESWSWDDFLKQNGSLHFAIVNLIALKNVLGINSLVKLWVHLCTSLCQTLKIV